MLNLSKLLLRSAEIHEESWNDTECRYKIDLDRAISEGRNVLKISEKYHEIVYMLLVNCWNESIQWAKTFRKKEVNE